MKPVRELLHRELAKDALSFLFGQGRPSRLFVVETLSPLPPNVYNLKMSEVMASTLSSHLRQKALEQAESSQDDALAIGFVEPNKAWLHLTFLVPGIRRWRARYDLELPTPERYLQTYELATAPRVVTTD